MIVQPNRQKKLVFPQKAIARDIYRTLAVGVIDPKNGELENRTGYLGHFEHLKEAKSKYDAFEKFMEDIFRDAPDKNALDIGILIGSVPSPNEVLRLTAGPDIQDPSQDEKEPEVVKFLKKQGLNPENISYYSLERDPGESYNLTVDTNTNVKIDKND